MTCKGLQPNGSKCTHFGNSDFHLLISNWLQGIAHPLPVGAPPFAVAGRVGLHFPIGPTYFFPHFMASMSPFISPFPSAFIEDIECAVPPPTGTIACAYGVFAHIR
jgi:hypothetical protein